MSDDPTALPDGEVRPDSVALVTGANSGIGYEIARGLCDRGITVWLGARNLDRGEAAAATLGDGARAVQLDVTDQESVAAAARRIESLDILMNNAGINPGREDLERTDIDQFRRAYETNVFGLFAVTKAFAPALRRSEHPRIVNVSSGTGSLAWNSGPNPQFDWARVQGGGIAYRSSKTAVNAVTLLAAQSLGDRFKVNALAPGARATNLLPNMTGRAGDPAEAAAGAIRLALLPDDGPTGGLWSWDGTRAPW
ncbi:SDR family NAD(P)-dependent oxidoreductase [Solicola gregarius]|uniref:SDR family NAD(P)-dependent oxidoreductase n=1 Tax=Solicola gregarius TaxID=2908642 RepID=A0AA46TLM8_9ACTN|nr:SDR family NAD(P)-dependent oxidoreductase [Solicola gregarius]UYM07204.1 SDR family NAD(P)-dependent oxidoreductase [Solicola gregarius]